MNPAAEANLIKPETSNLPPIYVRNYEKDEYGAACQNWDIAVSSIGNLYIANSAGLLTYDGNNWRTYPLPDGSEVLNVVCRNDTVYTKSETTVGYWLTDAFGQLIYNPLSVLSEDIVFRSFPDSFPFSFPQSLWDVKPAAYVQIRGFNIIGTLINGLYIVNNKGDIVTNITERSLLLDNMIHAMEYYNNQQFYIAYDNGFSIIDISPSIWNLGKRSKVGKLKNAALVKDTVYIETNTGYYKRALDPLDRFETVTYEEAFSYLKEKRPTDSLMIKELSLQKNVWADFYGYDNSYQIGDSLIWLVKGGEAGLFRFEKNEYKMTCRFFPDNYRLNMVTRDAQIFPLNDSIHIFSTTQGVILLNTNQLIKRGQVSGTSHRINRIEYSTRDSVYLVEPDKKEISLPYNFHRLSLFVGSSVFTANNQISYKLDDVQSEWSAWQKEGAISFLQLPEGKYTLRIRKYVPTGDFPEIIISLQVYPPWYNTLTAYAIYILMIWIIIYGTIRYHICNQNKEIARRTELDRKEEQQRIERIKSEFLEKELQNKTNELTLQTSLLVRKNRLVNELMNELDKQKETLGERYPNRLYRRLRSMMEGSLNDQSDWISFETYLNSAHRDFMERLQQTFQDITPGDIRLCCLLRMNLSTKEIASILNISIRAVELRRYRLRKRINLDSDINLVDYLMTF